MKRIVITTIFLFNIFCQTVCASEVLITGANQGIGMGFVKHYLKEGRLVYATYRSTDKSKELLDLSIQNNRLIPIQVDFENVDGSIKAIKGAVKEGPISILILNAGHFAYKANTLGALEVDDFQRSFTVNTIAPLKLTEALLDNLKSGNDKKIVAISSRRGSIQHSKEDQYKGRYAYRGSKAALNAEMSALSLDLPDTTILILHPGRVATAFTKYDGISVEESVGGMVKVISTSTPEQSGKFYDYQGQSIPW